MNKKIKDRIKNYLKKTASSNKAITGYQTLSSEGTELTNLDTNSILTASKKLIDINKGLTDPDERDALSNKKIFNTDSLIAERINLDSGKILLNTLKKVARSKSLKSIPAGFLDNYTIKHLIGNPLSLPLEEINPMHIYEQNHRITQMGPGGIGSSSAISSEAQNVHPSEFGYFDPFSGPESEKAGIDVRVSDGVKLGNNGKIYQKFFDRRNKRYVWLSPDQIEKATVGIPD